MTTYCYFLVKSVLESGNQCDVGGCTRVFTSPSKSQRKLTSFSKMSDREHFPSDSDSETDDNSAHSDENTDQDEIFLSAGEILRYQDEPLATSDSDEECMSEETNDEDGHKRVSVY